MGKCNVCGKKLNTYTDTGHHDNWAGAYRFKHYLEKGLDYMILKLDMRKDNFCNVQKHNLDFQEQLIKCASIWLVENGHQLEKDLFINYFERKRKIINYVIKNNEDILNKYTYVVDCNAIVDFYYDHNLKNKQFDIIKIKNTNERLDAEYFWSIKVDGEYFTILSK